MRLSVSYDGRNYGNLRGAPAYGLRITRGYSGQGLHISFKFDKPAGGFGVGWSQGAVTDGTLEISNDAAQALAHALLLAANPATAEPIVLSVDETPESARPK